LQAVVKQRTANYNSIELEDVWKLDYFLIYRIIRAERAIRLPVNFRPG
jgi:hypothetical protein